MRTKHCMRMVVYIVSFSTFILLADLFLSVNRVSDAAAGVKVEDLNLYGDFRFRYEIDDRDGQTENRVRERIRLRPGFDYNVSDSVSFGARLSTQTDRQSPHSTLGSGVDTTSPTSTTTCTEGTPNTCTTTTTLTGAIDAGARDNIAIDKAFLKIKFLSNGFVWFGKESVPFWEQNEAFWDADINPEGIAAGYKFTLGPVGLLVQGGQFVLSQNGFTKNDTLLLYQGVGTADVGPLGLTLAYGVADVSDKANSRTVPGGEATYTAASIQVNTKKMLPIPVAVGFDSLTSDASANDTGSVITARVGKLDDKGDWRVSLLLYDIEKNAVPGAGALAQDDIQSSSNFEATEINVEYAFSKKFNIMLRYSDEETKIADGSTPANQGRNRMQVNLNVKF